MGKRKPAYLKILQGMNACYGSEDRDCSNCPYDRYNDRDFYGQGSALCMEKLNEAAKKWTESMSMFTHCGDCCCWSKNIDENGNWDPIALKDSFGRCSVWNTVMGDDEYCSRGAIRG